MSHEAGVEVEVGVKAEVEVGVKAGVKAEAEAKKETKEQMRAFNMFKSGKSLCITGPGGTGKSFLIGKIKKHCHDHMMSYAVTALTGAAGSLIGGQTLHGWAGIGLAKESAPDIVRTLNRRPDLIKKWKSIQVLIIDEISMASMELFNKLHLIGQSMRKNSLFYGGIQLVLCGDFAQLAPIGSDKFCFESSIWNKYISPNTVYLSEIFRQVDPIFQRVLSNMRLSDLTKEDKEVLNSRIIVDESDAEIIISDGDNDVQKITPTVLYPRKKDVNRINTIELNKLISQGVTSKTYKCDDFVINRRTKQPVPLKATHTNTLNKCTNAPEILVLAVGAQVMLTKNKCVEDNMVNGSRGVILEINAAGNPVIMFDHGTQYTIMPENFEMESGENQIIRKQIPLILAWALTIHKCQGATLTNVITDLSDIFGYAMAYVTLSRVKSLDGLFIISINYSKIKCNPKVKKYYAKLAQVNK
jgi:ATP-dependent DNA helicase PIF1